MTVTQMLAPVFDVLLSLPLIIRLFQKLLLFSNATRMRVQSKPEINELV